MQPVNERPPLPQAIPGTFAGLMTFTADLTKQLISILGEYGFRINRVLPKDGTEAMESPLPLVAIEAADLPDAADWAGAIIYVSDGASGAKFRGSNGTSWVNLDVPASSTPTESFVVAVTDEATNITTGTAKIKFRMPYAFTLSAVRASLSTAQPSGSILTVDINEGGSSIFSTVITIDNGETTSTTAATPPVISDTSLADDAEMSVDIDQVGDAGAKGLKIALIGTRT